MINESCMLFTKIGWDSGLYDKDFYIQIIAFNVIFLYFEVSKKHFYCSLELYVVN